MTRENSASKRGRPAADRRLRCAAILADMVDHDTDPTLIALLAYAAIQICQPPAPFRLRSTTAPGSPARRKTTSVRLAGDRPCGFLTRVMACFPAVRPEQAGPSPLGAGVAGRQREHTT